MLWIVYAVAAQFISAVVSILDKFIVTSRRVPNPFMYALYVCALSAFSIIAFAFGHLSMLGLESIFPRIDGIDWSPPVSLLLVSVVCGVTLFLGLYFLFESLRSNDASDVLPVVGAVAAITTLAMQVAAGEQFSLFALSGIGLIVAGTLLVSHFRFSKRSRLLTLLAGITFGFQAIALDTLFNTGVNFDTAFFWSRILIAVVAGVAYVAVVLPYHKATKTKRPTAKQQAKSIAWVISNKALAGISGILLLRAIQEGEVTIVQALGGVQFVFLFAFAALFGRYTPSTYGEDDTRGNTILHKGAATVLIALGFAMLFL